MKNFIMILSAFGLGYAANSETGKKVQAWVKCKAQEQFGKVTKKLNKATEKLESEIESCKVSE